MCVGPSGRHGLSHDDLRARLAVQGSTLKAEARKSKRGRDFSLIDGIGLASARSRQMPMLTFDGEFEGFPDVIILRRGP